MPEKRPGWRGLSIAICVPMDRVLVAGGVTLGLPLNGLRCVSPTWTSVHLHLRNKHANLHMNAKGQGVWDRSKNSHIEMKRACRQIN